MIFQLHNLLPTLTAIENVQVPMFELGLIAREVGVSAPSSSRPWGSRGGSATGLRSCRAGSASVSPSLGRSPTSRRSCSRTSRPGASTPKPAALVLDLIERLRAESGLTVVLVTHDPTLPRGPTGSCTCSTAANWSSPALRQELATVAS